MIDYQRCTLCDGPTGKAGAEDSLYIGELPVCEWWGG